MTDSDLAMPVLFVGHGSPMNAIEDNAFHRSWQSLGRELPKPAAILCISAHWETRGVYLTANERPATIHDFYGFPRELFDVRYPAPGAPALVRRIQDLVSTTPVGGDQGRGFDHGAWSVLVAMYPRADVPLVQLSLDTSREPDWHFALARCLTPLRKEGVLVLASGNVVHNLKMWRPHAPAPYDWAERFDNAVVACIEDRRHRDLCDWQDLAPEARLAVPTPEHYLPLLYALALRGDDDSLRVFNRQVESSLSMTSVQIGS